MLWDVHSYLQRGSFGIRTTVLALAASGLFCRFWAVVIIPDADRADPDADGADPEEEGKYCIEREACKLHDGCSEDVPPLPWSTGICH